MSKCGGVELQNCWKGFEEDNRTSDALKLGSTWLGYLVFKTPGLSTSMCPRQPYGSHHSKSQAGPDLATVLYNMFQTATNENRPKVVSVCIIKSSVPSFSQAGSCEDQRKRRLWDGTCSEHGGPAFLCHQQSSQAVIQGTCTVLLIHRLWLDPELPSALKVVSPTHVLAHLALASRFHICLISWGGMDDKQKPVVKKIYGDKLFQKYVDYLCKEAGFQMLHWGSDLATCGHGCK